MQRVDSLEKTLMLGGIGTVEFLHAIAKRLEDTAYNTVLTTVDLNTYLFFVRRTGILYIIGLDLTILKLNTIGNLLEVVGSDVLIEEHMIDLLLQILGMCQLGSQVTIVGEQEHTRGVTVQTTYGPAARCGCPSRPGGRPRR